MLLVSNGVDTVMFTQQAKQRKQRRRRQRQKKNDLEDRASCLLPAEYEDLFIAAPASLSLAILYTVGDDTPMDVEAQPEPELPCGPPVGSGRTPGAGGTPSQVPADQARGGGIQRRAVIAEDEMVTPSGQIVNRDLVALYTSTARLSSGSQSEKALAHLLNLGWTRRSVLQMP